MLLTEEEARTKECRERENSAAILATVNESALRSDDDAWYRD